MIPTPITAADLFLTANPFSLQLEDMRQADKTAAESKSCVCWHAMGGTVPRMSPEPFLQTKHPSHRLGASSQLLVRVAVTAVAVVFLLGRMSTTAVSVVANCSRARSRRH